MTLLSLDVEDFRCIERATLEFDSQCTLIVGENASGKTSLLESIYALTCGRTFRGGATESLIREGADRFRVVGKVELNSTSTVVGVEISKDRNEIRVAGQRAKGFAAVAHLLPVRVIDPEVHRLLEDGSRLRRRFLDWGVFHVEPRFVEAWRRYQVALQQRNAAIKSKASRKEIASWDQELLESGAFVALARKNYLNEIGPFVTPIAQALLGTAVELRSRQGWTDSQTFEEALAAAWPRDQRYGVTTVGPHRADFVAVTGGVPAKQRVSRGQQKLLVAALMLAQLRHRHRDSDDRALLLLDDPAAELDVDNLGKLMEQVAHTPAQLVVTSTQETRLDSFRPRKKFHVKHGQIDTLQ